MQCLQLCRQDMGAYVFSTWYFSRFHILSYYNILVSAHTGNKANSLIWILLLLTIFRHKCIINRCNDNGIIKSVVYTTYFTKDLKYEKWYRIYLRIVFDFLGNRNTYFFIFISSITVIMQFSTMNNDDLYSYPLQVCALCIYVSFSWNNNEILLT